MNERLKQTLEVMAKRGADPGAATVWEQARAAAPGRRRRQRIRMSIAVATATLVVAGVAVALRTRSSSARHVVIATPTTRMTPSPSEDAIAFTRDLAIWTIEPSGAGLRRLTPTGCCSFSSWNPAHTLLALDYNVQLTVMKPDGTRLNSFDATTIFPPAWSPDGKQIAFAVSPSGGSNGGPIEIVDAAGRSAPRVVGHVFAGALAWSPDGKQIAYTALDEPLHIGVLTVATGARHTVLNGPGTEQYDPAWSSVTGRLAFASDKGIYDVRPDGTDLHQVVACAEKNCNLTSPVWSPNGASIAFGRDVGGVPQLFVIGVSTRRAYQITVGATGSELPSW